MYYLRDGLAQIGRRRLGRVLSVLYAIFTLVGVFGAGNLFQSNQVAAIETGDLAGLNTNAVRALTTAGVAALTTDLMEEVAALRRQLAALQLI